MITLNQGGSVAQVSHTAAKEEEVEEVEEVEEGEVEEEEEHHLQLQEEETQTIEVMVQS